MTIGVLSWELQASFPLLVTLQLMPLVVAGILIVGGPRPTTWPLAFGGAIAELGLAVLLYRRFDFVAPAMQFGERQPILGPLTYYAAVDGIGVLFVLLSALVGALVVLSIALRWTERPERLLALVFVCQASVMSQLVTIDLLWYALASGVQVAIVGRLLTLLSTRSGRLRALGSYRRYMVAGNSLLLAGIAVLGVSQAAAHSMHWRFDLPALVEHPLPTLPLSVSAGLLLAGLAIRMPLFPLHGWLTTLLARGGALVPVLLLGVNTALFALLRFLLPLLQAAQVPWRSSVVVLAAGGVLLAAVLAFAQRHTHGRLAYALVSAYGLLVTAALGLGDLHSGGIILLAANLGLAAAVLLFVVETAEARAGDRRAAEPAGLLERVPLLGVTAVLAITTIIGWPGTTRFAATQSLIQAAVERFGAFPSLAVLCASLSAAGWLLWGLQRPFLAASRWGDLAGAAPRMLAIVLLLTLLAASYHFAGWWASIEQPIAVLGP